MNSGLSAAKNGIGMNGYFQYLLMLMQSLVYCQFIAVFHCQFIMMIMMILMRISRAPHFRLSSATLPKSEIAVVLELSMNQKNETTLFSTK